MPTSILVFWTQHPVGQSGARREERRQGKRGIGGGREEGRGGTNREHGLEQFLPEPATDHASDVCLLGVVQLQDHRRRDPLEVIGEGPDLVVQLLAVHLLCPVEEIRLAQPAGEGGSADLADDQGLQGGQVVVLGQAHQLEQFVLASILVAVSGYDCQGVFVEVLKHLSKGCAVVVAQSEYLLMCFARLGFRFGDVVDKPRRTL